MKTHTTHVDITKRLKRAAGHLTSVIAMLEDGKPCLAIAQQLKAVESAITKAKQTLIHDHIDHCLDQSLPNQDLGDDTLKEFKDITKFL